MSTQVGNLQNVKCRFSFVLQKLFFGTLTLVFLNSLVFAENEALIIDENGNVGIGIERPRSALDTGTGVISGAANGYQKAQFSLSGGGEVTWKDADGRLKWTDRFVAVSMERSSAFPDGYIDINQPVSDIPAENVYDNKKRSVNKDGVLLKKWEALYAVHALGGKKDAVSFRIVFFRKNFNAPSNWLLVAVVNGDDQTIKLGTGTIITPPSIAEEVYGEDTIETKEKKFVIMKDLSITVDMKKKGRLYIQLVISEAWSEDFQFADYRLMLNEDVIGKARAHWVSRHSSVVILRMPEVEPGKHTIKAEWKSGGHAQSFGTRTLIVREI